MDRITTYKRNTPNSANGDSITIITTYSSMFPYEIDQIEKACKENIGYALLQKDCKGLQYDSLRKRQEDMQEIQCL